MASAWEMNPCEYCIAFIDAVTQLNENNWPIVYEFLMAQAVLIEQANKVEYNQFYHQSRFQTDGARVIFRYKFRLLIIQNL